MCDRKEEHSSIMRVQRRCEGADAAGSFQPGEHSAGRPVAGEGARKNASGETRNPFRKLIRWLVGPRRRDHDSDVRHDQ